MTTPHRTLTVALVVAAWLATCANGDQGNPAPQVVTIPDFRLTVPAGKWSIERDVPNAHITLIEHAVSKLGPVSDVRIDVRVVRPDSQRRLAPATAARAAVDAELAAVKARAKAGWTYNASPRDTTIGCRVLAGSRYLVEPAARSPTVGDEDGTIFGWATPDYQQSGRVVLFRLTMVTRGAIGVRMASEAPFYKVIEGLELQSSAMGIIC